MVQVLFSRMHTRFRPDARSLSHASSCKGVLISNCWMVKDGVTVSTKTEVRELFQENRNVNLTLKFSSPLPGILH